MRHKHVSQVGFYIIIYYFLNSVKELEFVGLEKHNVKLEDLNNCFPILLHDFSPQLPIHLSVLQDFQDFLELKHTCPCLLHARRKSFFRVIFFMPGKLQVWKDQSISF